jgi:hypothetical protein
MGCLKKITPTVDIISARNYNLASIASVAQW